MEKDKKKTLTISTSLKKKIDTSSISSGSKKSYSVDKKKFFKPKKNTSRPSNSPNINTNQDSKKKIFTRKFIEQQATKDFIKKDSKPAGKSKLKLKGPIDKSLPLDLQTGIRLHRRIDAFSNQHQAIRDRCATFPLELRRYASGGARSRPPSWATSSRSSFLATHFRATARGAARRATASTPLPTSRLTRSS